MGSAFPSGVELPGTRLEGGPGGLAHRSPAGARQPAHRSPPCARRWSPAGRCRCGSATRCSPFWNSIAISRLREDREAMAAMETVAASLGQMLARSQERGRARGTLSPAGDSARLGGRRNLRRRPPGARQLCQSRGRAAAGAPAAGLTGKPVHELLHGSAQANRRCGEDCPLRRATAPQHGRGRRRHHLPRRRRLLSRRVLLLPPFSIRAAFPALCSASATSASAMPWTGSRTSSSPPSATNCARRSPPSAARWGCSPPACSARSTTRPPTCCASPSPTPTGWCG